MPMVEKCIALEEEDGIPGHVRLVSGFMFPQEVEKGRGSKENWFSWTQLHSVMFTGWRPVM